MSLDGSEPSFPSIDRPTSRPTGRVVHELITPGDDVPARRVRQRKCIGASGEPMVEVDGSDTLVFVGGVWDQLVGFTKPGPAALDALLDGVSGDDQAAVRTAIDSARVKRVASVWDHHALAELPYLKVLPMPSATAGGVMNVLVGLSATSTIERGAEPLSMARHRVVGSGGA